MESQLTILVSVFIVGTILMTVVSWWILLSEEKSRPTSKPCKSELTAPDYYKESKIKIDPEKILYSEMAELKNSNRKLEID